ncbi:VOC family protein [Tropicimonas sp. S265A]|uniref:VOC family protein n=1 Tax=Tropicimonas sp. S265A TaxID=3415134 RepID=UPI003C7BDB50
MAFEIHALVPELWCSNFDASMDFYTGVLGFDVVQQRGRDPHAYLSCHGAQIMLAHWPLDGTWVPWHPGDMARPFGRGINLQFMVPDVTALYGDVRARDVQPLVDIYEGDIWKTDCMDTRRQFLVSDPDGYVLRFAQSLRQRPIADADVQKLTAQYGSERT